MASMVRATRVSVSVGMGGEMGIAGVTTRWWNLGMTDREIWEQLAGVMGMLLEAEEVQVALARNFHERFRLVEARLAVLTAGDPKSEAALQSDLRRILARVETRHENYGAVLAELKRLISQLPETPPE